MAVTPSDINGLNTLDKLAIKAIGFLIQKYESNSIPVSEIVTRAYEYASAMLSHSANLRASGDTGSDSDIYEALEDIAEAAGSDSGDTLIGNILDENQAPVPLTVELQNVENNSTVVPFIVKGNDTNGQLNIKTNSTDTVAVKGGQSVALDGTTYTDALKVVIAAGGGGGGTGGTFNGKIKNAEDANQDPIPLVTKDEALRSTTGVTNTLYTEIVQTHKDLGYDWQGLSGTASTQHSDLQEIAAAIRSGGGGGSITKDTTPGHSIAAGIVDYVTIFAHDTQTLYKLSIVNLTTNLEPYLDTRYGLILEGAGSTTSFTLEFGKYLKATGVTGTSGEIGITLPSTSGTSSIASLCMLYLTVSSGVSSNLTLDFGSTSVLYKGAVPSLAASKTYELDFLWNGTTWIVGCVEIVSS